MQSDESITRKNRPVPENERPDWATSMPDEEWQSYIHSPQCKVCNAVHDGLNLRSEIEVLVIERATYVDVSNIVFERYGLRLAPFNISRHMDRHAPSYRNALNRLLQSELSDVLNDTAGLVVNHTIFLLGVIQVAWDQILSHPEKVSVADGMRAAEKLSLMTVGIDVLDRRKGIDQEDINRLLDTLQEMHLTPDQKDLLMRKFYGEDVPEVESECPPSLQGQAPEGVNELSGVVVDGEYIALDDIPSLPDEEPVGGDEA